MSEEERQGGEGNHRGEGAGRGSARIGDGIRQGIGVLSALKDALDETIQEARDRGDLSAERARQVMKEALEKAQSAAGEARERLDFAQQGDLEALSSAVEAMGARVAALEAHVFGAPGAGGDPRPSGAAEPGGAAVDGVGEEGTSSAEPRVGDA
jgi:polyhydroxyalkanoate synthesis regulator phasin